MNKVVDLINAMNFFDHFHSDEKFVVDENVVKIVNRLFDELQVIFPAFRQAWPTEDIFRLAKKHWVKTFMSVGISRLSHIRYGIKRCRLLETPFVPPAAQFVRWCIPLPEEVGLLPEKIAFKVAFTLINGDSFDFKNESQEMVLRHVIQETGSWEMKHLSKEKIEDLFSMNYEIGVRDFIRGEIKPIPKALEAPKRRDLIDEYMNRHPEIKTINNRESAMKFLRSSLRRQSA